MVAKYCGVRGPEVRARESLRDALEQLREAGLALDALGADGLVEDLRVPIRLVEEMTRWWPADLVEREGPRTVAEWYAYGRGAVRRAAAEADVDAEAGMVPGPEMDGRNDRYR